MGTLSAGLGPGLLGAPRSQRTSFAPALYVAPGTAAVTAVTATAVTCTPSQTCSAAPCYRSNYRHKACFSSWSLSACVQARQKDLSLSLKEAPRQTSLPTRPHLPSSSPCMALIHGTILPTGSGRESLSGRSLASAISGKTPSPLSSSSSSYKLHAEQQLLHAAK